MNSILLLHPTRVFSFGIHVASKRGELMQILPVLSQLSNLHELYVGVSVSARELSLVLKRAATRCPCLTHVSIDAIGVDVGQSAGREDDSGSVLLRAVHEVVNMPSLVDIDLKMPGDSPLAGSLFRIILACKHLRGFGWTGAIPGPLATMDIELSLDSLRLVGSEVHPSSRALVAALVASINAGGSLQLTVEGFRGEGCEMGAMMSREEAI